MKNNAKISELLIIVMLALNGIANAQSDSLELATVKEKSLAMASRMERELALSPAQTQQIVQLAQERFDNLKLESPNDPARFENVNKKAWTKLATILSKEQYTKYLELRTDSRKQKDEFLKRDSNYRFSDEDLELDF